MFNELKQHIKEFNGNVLTIGIDNDTFLTRLQKSKSIKYINILYNKKSSKKLKDITSGVKAKNINIKKLKKKFKKKETNTVIVNYNSIKKFMKYFIPQNIYINNGFTYIYGYDKYIDEIVKKYNRYNITYELKTEGDNFLLIINNTNSQNNYFKDKWFIFKDGFLNIIDIIADVLIN